MAAVFRARSTKLVLHSAILVLLVVAANTAGCLAVQRPYLDAKQHAVLKELAQQWGKFKGSTTWSASGGPRRCNTYVGVRCNPKGLINNMTLVEAGAKGPIGTLTKLASLRYLDLSSNAINGTISSLSKLRGLVHLDLSGNPEVSKGFEALPAIRGLAHLDLSDSGLEGPVPAFLATMRLTYLDLSLNRLKGTIPAFIGFMKSLVYLNLAATGEEGLSGPLPRSIGGLANLKELYLHKNRLMGRVNSIGKLTKLQRLLLGDNYFRQTFPANFQALRNLDYLSMRYNSFSGELPSFIGNLTKLSFLSLNDNLLAGYVPASFKNLQNLQTLNLQNNRLSGYMPDFRTQSKLKSIDVSGNYITGPLPKFASMPESANFNSNYFFGSSAPATTTAGKAICSADIGNNCIAIPSSYSCGSKPKQRVAKSCLQFCGTTGSSQCGGKGFCTVEVRHNKVSPICMCSKGYKQSANRQSCVKAA
ncbi:hypothetical protein CLOM_g9028 [Closterium sp. NIES-68]|nr:hypothetical protein CLOM_g9028 [Closterium sp. NIES-68]GJP59288.1 hypothetical protein CLOP_g10184 [Closterium sp. NIES-67]